MPQQLAPRALAFAFSAIAITGCAVEDPSEGAEPEVLLGHSRLELNVATEVQAPAAPARYGILWEVFGGYLHDPHVEVTFDGGGARVRADGPPPERAYFTQTYVLTAGAERAPRVAVGIVGRFPEGYVPRSYPWLEEASDPFGDVAGTSRAIQRKIEEHALAEDFPLPTGPSPEDFEVYGVDRFVVYVEEALTEDTVERAMFGALGAGYHLLRIERSNATRVPFVWASESFPGTCVDFGDPADCEARLGDGERVGLALPYVVQPEPMDLPIPLLAEPKIVLTPLLPL